MSAQTTYAINQAIAYAGGLVDMNPREVVSFAAEGAIGFGIAVNRGTDPDKQVTVGGTAVIGVAVRSLDQEASDAAGSIQYDDTETVAVLRQGSIYAACANGCVPGDVVYTVDADGTLGSGAPAAGQTALAGASWETTATAGGLAVLRLA